MFGRALVGALLIVTGCSSDGSLQTDIEIEGRWDLVAVADGGTSADVVVGVNTQVEPWIEIGASISGSSGCNRFTGTGDKRYTYEDGTLVFGDVAATEIGCVTADGGSLMGVEFLFLAAMRGPDGVEVSELSESRMVWNSDDVTLIFDRRTS